MFGNFISYVIRTPVAMEEFVTSIDWESKNSNYTFMYPYEKGENNFPEL
jgi:hypothetical protein